MFDLVVFIWVPSNIRMERLKKKEIERYGSDIDDPNHSRNKEHNHFLKCAAAYDSGSLDMRSKISHERWIFALSYPIARIGG